MTVSKHLSYESCGICCKPIRAGHPFVVCKSCNCIIHKKCQTAANVIKFRDFSYCYVCIENQDIVRYNPFYQAPHFANNDMLDDEPVNYIESLNAASNILENCQTYSKHQFNTLSLTWKNKPHLSTLFLNVDGNYSNFDNFLVELQSLQHKFSVIGLAETNIDSENQNLYQITNYTSIYQSRILGPKQQPKSKGSGVGLYIHDSYNFSKASNLSFCNENIESLFITITNLHCPIFVGVIYRPPNGSLEQFNVHYKQILTEIGTNKAYILGDFNINMIGNLSSPCEEAFEEAVISNGFIPTISIPTHQMPHCSKTCIDNIHTNN